MIAMVQYMDSKLNEVLSEEGRVQKLLQVVEGVYVSKGNRHSNQGQWGKNQEDMYTRL